MPIYYIYCAKKIKLKYINLKHNLKLTIFSKASIIFHKNFANEEKFLFKIILHNAHIYDKMTQYLSLLDLLFWQI